MYEKLHTASMVQSFRGCETRKYCHFSHLQLTWLPNNKNNTKYFWILTLKLQSFNSTRISKIRSANTHKLNPTVNHHIREFQRLENENVYTTQLSTWGESFVRGWSISLYSWLGIPKLNVPLISLDVAQPLYMLSTFNSFSHCSPGNQTLIPKQHDKDILESSRSN